jgi:hypothetical protein
MNVRKLLLIAVVILTLNFIGASSGYSQTAILNSDPADATITSRGVECVARDTTPVSVRFPIGPLEFNPLFAAAMTNVTGHGVVTAALENHDGVKVAFINHTYDEDIASQVFIELGASGFNPKLEGLYEERSSTATSLLRYFISTGSFSTGTIVFKVRGILHNADVIMFGSSIVPKFNCSGAGMAELRLSFSLRYE